MAKLPCASLLVRVSQVRHTLFHNTSSLSYPLITHPLITHYLIETLTLNYISTYATHPLITHSCITHALTIYPHILTYFYLSKQRSLANGSKPPSTVATPARRTSTAGEGSSALPNATSAAAAKALLAQHRAAAAASALARSHFLASFYMHGRS